MKKIFPLIILIMATMLVSCSRAKTIPAGTYITDGDAAMLIIQEDEMTILGPKEISAAFTGQCRVEGQKLIVTLDGQDCIFLIQNNALALESGQWLENWVLPGTVFHLSEA